MPTSKLIAPNRVPGGAHPEGRERPGQARPHLPGSTLRPSRTKLCGLSVPEPACGSVPAARTAALHSSRCPADPGRSPAAGDQGRGQPGPTPASHRAATPTCAQPLSGLLLPLPSGSGSPFACRLPYLSRRRMSAFPAVTVKCLWILKSSILFLDPAPEIR